MMSLSLMRLLPRLDLPRAPPYGRGASGATAPRRLNRARDFPTRSNSNGRRRPDPFNLSTGGDVVIKLRPDLAPGHVERITDLAKGGFYDGVVFHRVIPGFMAQGGDPTGTGTGGSEAARPQGGIQPASRTSAAPARWRARSDPDSANSQFFICFDDARFLDGQYTVWGEVESGMEHVDAFPSASRRASPARSSRRRSPDARSRADHRRVGRAWGRVRSAAVGKRPALVLVARRKDRLEELAKELGNARAVDHRPVEAGRGDAADGGPRRAGREVELLVNNAGFGLIGRFAERDGPSASAR